MSAVLLFLACQSPKPYVYSEARLKDDGVHVNVDLSNIERVEIQGHSLSSGDSVVLPASLFHIGVNQLPILGDGLVEETLYLELRPDQVLELKCTGSANGQIHIRETGSEVASAVDCGVGDGGFVTGKLSARTGETILIDGKEVDHAIHLDARAGLWEEPLVAFRASKEIRSSMEHQLPIVVRHPSGAEWEGVVSYQTGGTDLMATFLRKLPESAEGMPPGDQVALRWENGWRFSGSGQLGELSRFAKVVEQSEPRFVATCHYQSPGGLAVDIDTMAVDYTVEVVDRTGTQLGRRRFKSSSGEYGCSDIQFAGGGDVTLLPDYRAIMDWALAL